MIELDDSERTELCRIVEDNLREFVDELYVIDLVDLISFIRFESFPTVEDLINSSTELFFKPEMVIFSWVAGVDLRWDALPVVTLGLEFRHPDVSLFFNLTMRDAVHTVEILDLTVHVPSRSRREGLTLAFADARLPTGAGPSCPIIGAATIRRARRGLSWN